MRANSKVNDQGGLWAGPASVGKSARCASPTFTNVIERLQIWGTFELPEILSRTKSCDDIGASGIRGKPWWDWLSYLVGLNPILPIWSLPHLALAVLVHTCAT
jgi:hypothetical protein